MLTKEQIAERIAAAAAKKGPKRPHINNAELVEEFRGLGGRLLHVRPNTWRRGVTFAYIAKGRRVEVASALTHTNDGFEKKMGTKTAIEHFREGKTIHLPVGTGLTAFDVITGLKHAF